MASIVALIAALPFTRRFAARSFHTAIFPPCTGIFGSMRVLEKYHMTNPVDSRQVVTRFAPSPTGHLHIGGARTAIFSWLLARKMGGRFVLRIEDTDRERSRQEYTDAILESMRWLGLDWDADPIYQSQRDDVYNKYIDRLIEEGKAYWCECSPEEVEAMREAAREAGDKPKYNGRCRARNLGPGEGRVVRFKAPVSGKTSWVDLVKGPLGFDNTELDDMIIRRSDGSPTYNLAVVVDDHEQNITHVLRGDDHVSNTPKQIMLYEALGFPIPKFGHVPMILGSDRKKLSKRHGALSVMEYEKMGFLPQALVNYLVRLGWAYGDQEIFELQELIEKFSTDGLSSSPAGFDPDKLQWLNAHYMKATPDAELAGLVYPFVEAAGFSGADKGYVAALVPLLKERAKDLPELAEAMRFMLVADAELAYDEAAVAKALTEEGKKHVAGMRALFAGLESFTKETTHDVMARYVEDNGLKFKAVGPPLRVEVLGRERTLARMDRAVAL
jgi:glutamyl-tRNA synthetase